MSEFIELNGNYTCELSEEELKKRYSNGIKITYGRWSSPRVIKKKLKKAILERQKLVKT